MIYCFERLFVTIQMYGIHIDHTDVAQNSKDLNRQAPRIIPGKVRARQIFHTFWADNIR